mgnify:FL=1
MDAKIQYRIKPVKQNVMAFAPVGAVQRLGPHLVPDMNSAVSERVIRPRVFVCTIWNFVARRDITGPVQMEHLGVPHAPVVGRPPRGQRPKQIAIYHRGKRVLMQRERTRIRLIVIGKTDWCITQFCRPSSPDGVAKINARMFFLCGRFLFLVMCVSDFYFSITTMATE